MCHIQQRILSFSTVVRHGELIFPFIIYLSSSKLLFSMMNIWDQTKRFAHPFCMFCHVITLMTFNDFYCLCSIVITSDGMFSISLLINFNVNYKACFLFSRTLPTNQSAQLSRNSSVSSSSRHNTKNNIHHPITIAKNWQVVTQKTKINQGFALPKPVEGIY